MLGVPSFKLLHNKETKIAGQPMGGCRGEKEGQGAEPKQS